MGWTLQHMEETRRVYKSLVGLNEVETNIMIQRLMCDDYGNILKYGGYYLYHLRQHKMKHFTFAHAVYLCVTCDSQN
jgi:hypothetical protein